MKKNIGEWSELLVILKLLYGRRVQMANAARLPIPGQYFQVKRVSKLIKGGGMIRYLLSEDHVDIYDEDDIHIASQSISAIGDWIQTISAAILRGGDGNGSFEITGASAMITGIGLANGFKSPSNSKVDIELSIPSPYQDDDIVQGFSIKSYAGARSTLMNANRGTTSVVGRFKGEDVQSIVRTVNQIDPKSIIGRGACLHKLSTLIGVHVENEVFRRNLIFIDTRMPELYAHLVMASVASDSDLMSCLEYCIDRNVLNLRIADADAVYEYKLKLLLAEIAMGMTPGTPWSGADRMYGGFLLLDKQLTLLCLAPSNREEFESYLLNTTRFETPSTERNPQGEAEINDEFISFRLNRQIRF